ncbi:hypothetical protein AB6A40_005740 [Gnathostoma spinigerum]|uniref:ShKT domain-containing protein n=1 Tax=Gnathostoma spinigerum TaxID=75299 RepID=A0ABD6ENM2_9BILA
MKILWLTVVWLLALAVTAIAEECRDDNKSCKIWADDKQCDLNPRYMKKNCRKSCKICKESNSAGDDCTDSDKKCELWAKKGECENNPNWMLKNCKKSCKQCKESGSDDCTDSDKKCESWAKKGECENNPNWMLKNCKKSCKQCSGGPTTDGRKPSKPSAGGGDLPDVGDINCGGSMTNEIRTLLVNGHNKRRSDMAQGRMLTWKSIPVQSGANVQAFTWDCDLERSSEQWAQYCSTEHSGEKDRSENLHWEYGYPHYDATKTAENAMTGWWEEENDKDGFGYAPYTDWVRYGGNRHLIAMAWAKSNKMGCFVKTDCRYPYSGENMAYVVCQYKIRGNWINEAVMEVGPACSKCPSSTTCHQKSGLCV